MKLNAAIIDSCCLSGTITKSQAEHAQIEYPLRHGWRKGLIGRNVTQPWIDEFRRRAGVRAKPVSEKPIRDLKFVPEQLTPIGKLFCHAKHGYVLVVEVADGFTTLQLKDGLQVEVPDDHLPNEWFAEENYPYERMSILKREFVAARKLLLEKETPAEHFCLTGAKEGD